MKIFSCLFAYRLSTIRVNAVFQRDEMHRSDPGYWWQAVHSNTLVSLQAIARDQWYWLQVWVWVVELQLPISPQGKIICRGQISICRIQVINEVIFFTTTLHTRKMWLRMRKTRVFFLLDSSKLFFRARTINIFRFNFMFAFGICVVEWPWFMYDISIKPCDYQCVHKYRTLSR